MRYDEAKGKNVVYNLKTKHKTRIYLKEEILELHHFGNSMEESEAFLV
jgi:hypothetical protein